MQKNRFQYYIKGYRYAPESFHAFKGLSGHRPVEIPLSDSQRQQMGYLCVTQSGKAAIDYVKRIERARARKPKSFVTYGFQVREDPRRYVYAPSLRCRPDAPLTERRGHVRELRAQFARDGGRVEQLSEQTCCGPPAGSLTRKKTEFHKEDIAMNQTYFHGFSSDMDSPEDIWSIPDTMTPFMGRRNPQSRTIRRKRERKRALKPQSRTRGRAAAHPLEILLPNGGVKPLALAMGSVKQISWRNGT